MIVQHSRSLTHMDQKALGDKWVDMIYRLSPKITDLSKALDLLDKYNLDAYQFSVTEDAEPDVPDRPRVNFTVVGEPENIEAYTVELFGPDSISLYSKSQVWTFDG